MGRYRVTRTLGEGEFAKVYECRRDGEGAPLALKAIKKAIVERHASNSILKAKRNIGRVGLEVAALRRFRETTPYAQPAYAFNVYKVGANDLRRFLLGPAPAETSANDMTFLRVALR